eukprot:2006954-Ditylum_brightwellii.AAC.1
MDAYAVKHSPQIRMNYTASNEHVPYAERNKRTIKERIYATYHHLPYNHLPHSVIKYLSKNDTSPRKLDYTKHGVYPFGEYVLGDDEPAPSNTQDARALDCIYLHPTSNMQGVMNYSA